MFKLRNHFFCLTTILLLAACGKPNEVQIEHDLPTTAPVLKPSADCLTAEKTVAATLLGLAGFNSANTTFLADNSCAVYVATSGASHALALLRANKAKNGFYTEVQVNDTAYPLWFDEPINSLGNFVSAGLSDCTNAALLLNKTFPTGNFSVKQNPNGPAQLKCYVQSAFSDDASFESYFAWTNPTSTTGELFHVNFTKNGMHTTVWIRLAR